MLCVFSLGVSLYVPNDFTTLFELQRICCIKQAFRPGRGFFFLQFFRANLGCYSIKWNDTVSVLIDVVVLYDSNICLS